ncbi:MAG: hypothetical protein KDD36_09425 [Flavobacteriales bacterium]|nr:hypothetical protein [Flavobacteriales bacterium]
MKKTLLILFLSVALIAISAGGYFYFKREIATGPESTTAIPSSALAVITIRDFPAFHQKLKRETTYWDSLLTHPVFSDIKTLMPAMEAMGNEWLEQRQILSWPAIHFSFHGRSESDPLVLVTAGLPVSWDETILIALVTTGLKGYRHTAHQTKKGTLHEWQGGGDKPTLFCMLKNHLLLVSPHSHLVEEAATTLETATGINKDEAFSELRRTALDHADANIFLSFPLLKRWTESYLDPEFASPLSFITDQNGWMEADLDLRTETIRMFGFAIPTAQGSSLLSHLSTGNRNIPRYTELLPENCIAYLAIEGDSMLTPDLPLTGEDDLEHDQLMGALAGCATIPIDTGLALISFWQTADATTAVNRISNDQSPFIYKGVFNIYPLNEDTTWHPFSGFPLGQSKWKYVAALNDYLLIAADTGALMAVFDAFETENTLHRSIRYNNFMKDVAPGEGLMFYLNLPEIGKWLRPVVNEESDTALLHTTTLSKQFDAVTLQLKPQAHRWYLDLYAKYHPYRDEERKGKEVRSSEVTTVELDDALVLEPFVIKNHYDGTREVLVQDAGNQLYLVNGKGEILWKKQIPERILGEAIQVDRYRNGKLQIMFNTRTHLYQIDRNGKDVTGYPLKLSKPATTGIAVLDYDNNRDYRILVPLDGGIIQNLDIDGKTVKGWDFKAERGNIDQPPVLYSIAGKDYIVAVTDKGKPYFLNRRGEVRITLGEEVIISPENGITLDERSKDFVSTDSTGNGLRISTSGKVTTQTLPPAGSHHRMIYTQVSGDREPEYVIQDKQRLTVYTQNAETVFEFTFNQNVAFRPLALSFSSNNTRIGLLDQKSHHVYLFNANGSQVPGFPVDGYIGFRVQDLDRDGTFELITGGGGNRLLIYRLSKDVAN